MTDPVITDEEVRYIPLTRGYVAIVDAGDFDRISAYKWCVTEQPAKYRTPYAMRKDRVGDKYISVYMHRRVMGDPVGMHVDHINGDGLDNRRANLRLCTHAQNQMNKNKEVSCVSRFKGVNFYKKTNKWTAKIKHDGKWVWLGYHFTQEDAARAYDAGAERLFGEFAKKNFSGAGETIFSAPNAPSKTLDARDAVLRGKAP